MKYPTGGRKNQATNAGYWKAKAKDKEVMNAGNQLVGIKRTLRYFFGRAPHGERTDWVMHEYRLEGKCTNSQSSAGVKVFQNITPDFEIDYPEYTPSETPRSWRDIDNAKVLRQDSVWYFYSYRNMKYPTGGRAIRTTNAGYWKATGKDKEVMNAENQLLAMKKTLVFYEDRAPGGVKTDWIMHEYRLERKCTSVTAPQTTEISEFLDSLFIDPPTEETTEISEFLDSLFIDPPTEENPTEEEDLKAWEDLSWGEDLYWGDLPTKDNWTDDSSSKVTLRSDALAWLDNWTDDSSSKVTLRSDALALGFKGFDTTFESRRILVILFQSSQAGGSDEIIFFHHEGMALLFGVGLPFSKVVLKSDGRITVYELGETKWTQLWKSSGEQMGSLILIDGKSRKGVFHGEDGLNTAFMEESISCPKQSLNFSPQQDSLSPFLSFLGLIRLKSSVGSVGAMSSGAVPTEMTPSVDKLNETGGRVAADLEFEKETKNTQKEVTIEIHLDPYTSTCEGSSSPELMSHRVEPVLRLTFFKESRKGGQILKRFSTAMEFLFFMRGELKSDRDRFGWYHDELQLSFRCLLRNAVTVDTKGVERSCEVIRGHDKSTSATKTPSDRNKHVYEGATSGGLKTVSTDNSSDETEDAATGFAMKLQGGPGEIGCLASIADDYDIWDQKGRRDAFFFSGRMADTLLRVDGDWRIWSDGLCRYELMGMRNFIMKFTGTPPNAVGWKSVGNTKGRQDYEVKVVQNICKVFEIDHSFSFFENLRSWDEWHVAHNAVAPMPISDIIDTVSDSSSGSPENRESGSVTQLAETIAQTPEHAVNSGCRAHPTGSTPEVTYMLEVLGDANRTALPSTTVSDMAHVLQVTTEHLNGARVATQLNDYMYELYKPAEEPDMEIILVHGLKLGDTDNLHLSTWISEDRGTYHVWPKTWLAQDFSHARVLSVTYDSHLYQTADQGRIDLHNTAESLMNSLFLEVGEESCRPLILVGYSFGGILIKQLCLHASQKKGSRHYGSKFESFMKRIRAIYFMGTPHRGMINPGFGTAIQENASPLFKDVELLNKTLARLHETFDLLRESYDWQVSGIGETNETRWGILQTVLVMEASARYGEPFTAVQADHISLSKPAAKTSIVYRQLEELIKQAYNSKVNF
ncbi:hypothetical protein R1sor_016405 [Riccia sorocarpa]|uniref:NAC domain-containing protein n=1 Tax=Riccia sorocarpa TaxID=122646 RepID=A0ABD3HGY2_9MARC